MYYYSLLYCVCVVDEVRISVNDLNKKFGLIRRSMIQCLDKCQIAVMTVVTLLSSVFGFDVRGKISENYHKNLSECKNNLEPFGYLNLYWNYLSFKSLSLLLKMRALKNDDFASVRKEMRAYLEEIKVFGQNTTLVAYCSAVPYTNHDPPPGFQKMVTEHDWPETVTLREVEDFQKDFLDTFGLLEHAMMLDGIRRGSFSITWFALLPPTIVQHLKGSKGKIKVLNDFKVISVKAAGLLLYEAADYVSDIVIKKLIYTLWTSSQVQSSPLATSSNLSSFSISGTTESTLGMASGTKMKEECKI